ncbi:MAG: IS5 family transposase [Bacteroidota bacterium]
MINYTPQNQLSLSLFKHPFETELDKENRWVKLAELVPWDELANVYIQQLQSDTGRLSVDVRTVIAALIIKHMLKLDDRGTVQMIQENIYLQYFCGLKAFTKKAVFDPSLFVDIRKRLGFEQFDAFNRLVIEKSEQLKPHQSRIKRKAKDKDSTDDNISPSSGSDNRGTLKIDATVADQEIKFPTDAGLLNASREKLEMIIDLLFIKGIDIQKPRTYRRKARRDFLNLTKKKRKSKNVIRKAIKVQLQYVNRDLGIVDKLLTKNPARELILSKKERELLKTIRVVYLQQKEMYDTKTNSCKDRIVNIFQPHVRPIVRGKEGKNTEFGSKINVSEVNGFCRVDRLSWNAYNESMDLELQVKNFRKQYGCYPKVLLADKIYLTRNNRNFLKENGIQIYGPPLGRPPKKDPMTAAQRYHYRKKAAERNHVEGKFGQAKRGYGLNKVKARLASTSVSWIQAIIFVMNLTKLLQVAEKYPNIFVTFLNWLKNQWQKVQKIFRLPQTKYFLPIVVSEAG